MERKWSGIADTKISALTAIAAVAGEDLLAVVDDPAGTPTTKKATVTQLQTFLGALQNVVEDVTPQLGGQLDVNGQALGDGTLELLTFTETGSAVNHVNITNAATGAGPTVGAAGDDTNVDLTLAAKGSGQVEIGGNRVLTTGDEGTGNGLDADTVDGVEASAFLQDVVSDTTPQLGGQLDVNGNALGDGTLELLTFTETGSAVNQLNVTNAATGSGPTLSAAGDDTNIDLLLAGKGTGVVKANGNTVYTDEWYGIALSDETTTITTGTNKATMALPFAVTVLDVFASVNTVSSSGLPTVDINEGGTTILSTKLTIDANEKTSLTAATPAVISDSSIAAGAEIGFDIDTAGTGAKGLKVWIKVRRA